MIIPYKDRTPAVSEQVFIAPDAWVIGDVELGRNAAVFFGAVIRGDLLAIKIGARTNIQDNTVIHTSYNRIPTVIGEQVTVGHRAMLHSCIIEDRSLIGMGAIVLDEAVISEGSLVAAGTVVTEGKKFPPRSLILGVPGKVVRQIEDKEFAAIVNSSDRYVDVAQNYITQFSDSSTTRK